MVNVKVRKSFFYIFLFFLARLSSNFILLLFFTKYRINFSHTHCPSCHVPVSGGGYCLPVAYTGANRTSLIYTGKLSDTTANGVIPLHSRRSRYVGGVADSVLALMRAQMIKIAKQCVAKAEAEPGAARGGKVCRLQDHYYAYYSFFIYNLMYLCNSSYHSHFYLISPYPFLSLPPHSPTSPAHSPPTPTTSASPAVRPTSGADSNARQTKRKARCSIDQH